MEIRKLLVAMDASDFSLSAAKHALNLGKIFNAQVDAIHIIDVVQLEGPFMYDLGGALGFEPFINFSNQVKTLLEEKGRIVLGSFRELAEKEEIPHTTIMEIGLISATIIEKSPDYDMIFIGKKGVNASYERGILGSNIESIVRKIEKPLFISPEKYHPIKHVLVGLNDTKISKKAYEYAKHISSAINIELKCIFIKSKPEEPNNLFNSIPEGAAEKIETVSRNVADSLVEITNRYENPLLCLGAYSRNKLIEMLLGSTTEAILRKDTLFPLLIIR